MPCVQDPLNMPWLITIGNDHICKTFYVFLNNIIYYLFIKIYIYDKIIY